MIKKLLPLTYTSDKEDAEAYRPYFDEIADNLEIINVGVTGAFGSGKSSLVRTLLKSNEKKRYIYVSYLPAKSMKDDKDKDVLRRALEKSILQQIAYQVSNTNERVVIFEAEEDITRKQKKEDGTKFIKSLTLFLLLLCGGYLYFFRLFDIVSGIYALLFDAQLTRTTLYFRMIHDVVYNPILRLITIVVYGVFCYLFFVRNVMEIAKSIQLPDVSGWLLQFKSKNFEIETRLREKKRIDFDNYNHKITELLVEHGHQIAGIIFEDLDWCEDESVLYQIRELALLTNQIIANKKWGNTDHIKFYYLVTPGYVDTKFFDMIIPVIPYQTKGNALDILIKNTDDYRVDRECLDYMSLFIHDARLARNVINELNIMLSLRPDILIKDEEERRPDLTRQWSVTKMLAAIVYKNLLPEDYLKLLSGKGALIEYLYNDHEEETTFAMFYEAYYELEEGMRSEVERDRLILIDKLLGAYFIGPDIIMLLSQNNNNVLSHVDSNFLRRTMAYEQLRADYRIIDKPEMIRRALADWDRGRKSGIRVEFINIYLLDYALTHAHDYAGDLDGRDASREFLERVKESFPETMEDFAGHDRNKLIEIFFKLDKFSKGNVYKFLEYYREEIKEQKNRAFESVIQQRPDKGLDRRFYVDFLRVFLTLIYEAEGNEDLFRYFFSTQDEKQCLIRYLSKQYDIDVTAVSYIHDEAHTLESDEYCWYVDMLWADWDKMNVAIFPEEDTPRMVQTIQKIFDANKYIHDDDNVTRIFKSLNMTGQDKKIVTQLNYKNKEQTG